VQLFVHRTAFYGGNTAQQIGRANGWAWQLVRRLKVRRLRAR